MSRLVSLVAIAAIAVAIAGCSEFDPGQAQEAVEGLSDVMEGLEDISEEFEKAAEDLEDGEVNRPEVNRNSPNRPESPLDKEPEAAMRDDDPDEDEYANLELLEFSVVDDGLTYEDIVDHYSERYGEPAWEEDGEALLSDGSSEVHIEKENEFTTTVIHMYDD